MMKDFKPMLAIDATDNLKNIKYPKFASYKLDGIRCIFHPQLGMIARSLKPIPNKQLQEKFKFMVEIARRGNRIYDGEIYSHDNTFQEITRACMTQDFTDKDTQKKLMKELKFKHKAELDVYIMRLLTSMKFHCFETYFDGIPEVFMNKISIIKNLDHHSVVPVSQWVVNSADEVQALFKKALSEGYEGLILRAPESTYKFGRSTLKEEFMLKVKPFETEDLIIKDVLQASEVDPEAEKKINELGYSVTSRKKDDRILIEKASAFLVDYNGNPMKVSLPMTDDEKIEIWVNRELYIGKTIEVKGMKIGAKDVLRHPNFVRFRDDKTK